jgi:putative addiction module component (TIGR02574 family)
MMSPLIEQITQRLEYLPDRLLRQILAIVEFLGARSRIQTEPSLEDRQTVSWEIAERLKLVEELWDSIASQPGSVPLTDRQRHELDSRLEQYHLNPDLGSSWEDVKQRLGQDS